ncbi:MAG: hypothetical protein CVV02_17485 [Firmicutes bacterium HGW-Firmicutes-7]|nr:MAG: hypothetical protein CVV02_17485 [Firmicutes bacterium HGW-Firmicutes-7]
MYNIFYAMFLTRFYTGKDKRIYTKERYNNLTSKLCANQVQEEHIEEITEKYRIDLHIPVILGIENEQLDKEVHKDIKRDVEKFINELKQSTNEYISPNIPYYLESSYNIYNHDKQILSFCIRYSNYYGGAHGMSYKICYNYDIKAGKRVALSDLFHDQFYVGAINNEIEWQIKKRNKALGYEAINAFKGISDRQKFYIKNGELVIYFDLYEIAPYVAGILEFSIPKKVLINTSYIYSK